MTTRECGTCTLCCELLPVLELSKKSNTRCDHQTATGCAIYRTRPLSCALWSCAWLTDDAPTRRPDEVHYVIDTYLDSVLVNGDRMTAIQVWVDPQYPDAHEDKQLRRLIQAKRCPAIIRRGSHDGFVLFPPSVTGGSWIQETGTILPKREFAERLTPYR